MAFKRLYFSANVIYEYSIVVEVPDDATDKDLVDIAEEIEGDDGREYEMCDSYWEENDPAVYPVDDATIEYMQKNHPQEIRRIRRNEDGELEPVDG